VAGGCVLLWRMLEAAAAGMQWVESGSAAAFATIVFLFFTIVHIVSR